MEMIVTIEDRYRRCWNRPNCGQPSFDYQISVLQISSNDSTGGVGTRVIPELSVGVNVQNLADTQFAIEGYAVRHL